MKIKAQARKNPKTGAVKYYATLVASDVMTLEDICERISDGTTVSRSAALAVLSAVQREVIFALKTGNSVRLGELGSFHLTISSEGVDTANEVDETLIRAIHVNYRKNSKMLKAFKIGAEGINFRRVDKVKKISTDNSITTEEEIYEEGRTEQ